MEHPVRTELLNILVLQKNLVYFCTCIMTLICIINVFIYLLFLCLYICVLHKEECVCVCIRKCVSVLMRENVCVFMYEREIACV